MVAYWILFCLTVFVGSLKKKENIYIVFVTAFSIYYACVWEIICDARCLLFSFPCSQVDACQSNCNGNREMGSNTISTCSVCALWYPVVRNIIRHAQCRIDAVMSNTLHTVQQTVCVNTGYTLRHRLAQQVLWINVHTCTYLKLTCHVYNIKSYIYMIMCKGFWFSCVCLSDWSDWQLVCYRLCVPACSVPVLMHPPVCVYAVHQVQFSLSTLSLSHRVIVCASHLIFSLAVIQADGVWIVRTVW